MKSICVPKNSKAQKELDLDANQVDDLLEFEIEDSIIDSLFETGFFHSLNKLTGSNIDKFEDDGIDDSYNLEKVLQSDIFDESFYHIDLYPVISEIKNLFEQALKFKTGIYFYL